MKTAIEIIQSDVVLENEIMKVAKLVYTNSKHGNSDNRDVMSRVNREQGSIRFKAFNVLNDSVEHWLNLNYVYTYQYFGTVILKPFRIIDDGMFKIVRFDVVIVDGELNVIKGDVGITFTEEVLK